VNGAALLALLLLTLLSGLAVAQLLLTLGGL